MRVERSVWGGVNADELAVDIEFEVIVRDHEAGDDLAVLVELDDRDFVQVDLGHVLGRHLSLTKQPPSLRRRSTSLDHVLRDAGLSDLKAKLEQLAMDARARPTADCQCSS